VLVTDNEPGFKGDFHQELLDLEVEHVFTTPYHPQGNGVKLIKAGYPPLKMAIMPQSLQQDAKGITPSLITPSLTNNILG